MEFSSSFLYERKREREREKSFWNMEKIKRKAKMRRRVKRKRKEEDIFGFHLLKIIILIIYKWNVYFTWCFASVHHGNESRNRDRI